jgi:Tfp pilus assembly protein PilZ
MTEQRKNERKKLIAFTPVYDCQRNLLLGHLDDLSMKGARLIGKKAMEVNKQIILAIGFPETPQFPARRAIIPSRVAWCKPEKNPQYFNVGFEFQEIDQENKTALKAILDKYRFRFKVPAQS